MSSIERRTTGGISSHTTRLGTNMGGTEQTESNADSAGKVSLTDFLLARIAEDEAAARAAGAWLRAPDGHNDDVLWSVADGRQAEPLLAQYAVGRHFDHIARHDPARVLAECEAKRQIVERYAYLYEHGDSGNMRWVLQSLAMPYADHPDYRDEWKP